MALLAYPLGYSAALSVHDVDVRQGARWTWVGLGNFTAVFRNPIFPEAVRNTVIFSAVVIIGSVSLGLLFAVILNERFPGRGLVRASILLPWALSEIVVAVAFGWIFNAQFGVFNGLYRRLA